MVLRLCSQCEEPAAPRKQVCVECWEARQPVTTRIGFVQARRSLVPDELTRNRVPEKDWPPGRRWCSGCQSFVRLIDCRKGSSRCRTCDGEADWESKLNSKYGVSRDTYSHLMNLQGGRCAICRNPPKKARLSLDHNHLTGENRGLICSRCNDELLGACYHKVEVLENALEYLRNPPLSGRWTMPEVRRGEPEPAPF